ncbi:MAG: hypothetical protein O2871_03905, partial [bacterium]|nr:hypothetical protein [bacterium]
MPNETDGTPITIDPIDSFVGKENQSGHFARFEGSINSNGEYKPTPQDKLKLSFTMTDEEAMLELQHGKYGSPEYYEAQQKLVAKVVGAYKKGEQNFLQNNDQLGVMTMFKHNLSEKWTVAQGLLKIDPTTSLQDNPSKYRLIHTLSDTSVVYQDAYNLTKAYVDNTLTDREDKVRFSNLTPELRREMLELFDLPAGAKEPNDGVSGVQEKWMYEGTKPAPEPQDPPEPDGGGSSGGGSPEGDGDGGSGGGNEQQEDADNIKQSELMAEIQEYLISTFSNVEIGEARDVVANLSQTTFSYLRQNRENNGRQRVIFFNPDPENPTRVDGRQSERLGVYLDEKEDFFNDRDRLQNALNTLEDMAARSGVSFNTLMIANIIAFREFPVESLRLDF